MIRLTLKPNKIEDTSGSNVDALPKLRLNFSNLKSTESPSSVAIPSNNATIEDQFILRLPASLASILNFELSENDYALPGDLAIRFLSPRTAIIRHPRFIKEAYPAVLVDAPTVMETLKSSNLSIVEIEPLVASAATAAADDDDEKQQRHLHNEEIQDLNVGQYYKVADLNQILMVLDLDTSEGQRIFNRIPSGLQDQLLKSLNSNNSNMDHNANANTPVSPVNVIQESPTWAQWPDGITPPMRQAKLRKFAPRPWHASSLSELERIEKEVERLLKADGQAIESKFSLIAADGSALLGDLESVPSATALSTTTTTTTEIAEFEQVDEYDDDDGDEDEDEENNDDNDDSEASDIEDMNDFAAEIEDNLLQEEEEDGDGNANANVTMEPESSALSTSDVAVDSTIPEPASEHERLVKDLEAKLVEKLKQAESVSNPLIKARIEDVIKQLEDNLRNLRQQS